MLFDKPVGYPSVLWMDDHDDDDGMNELDVCVSESVCGCNIPV